MYRFGKIFFSIVFFQTAAIGIAQNPSDNKNIGLCEHYNDTLTFEELKDCSLITISTVPPTLVTSYILSYYKADQMTLTVVHGFDNKIKNEEMQALLAIRPKKIFIEEVLGENPLGIIILGHRNIYLK